MFHVKKIRALKDKFACLERVSSVSLPNRALKRSLLALTLSSSRVDR